MRLVDKFVACCDLACFHRLGNRCDRNRLDSLESYIVSSCNRNESIAEEGAVWIVGFKIGLAAKGIVHPHAGSLENGDYGGEHCLQDRPCPCALLRFHH